MDRATTLTGRQASPAPEAGRRRRAPTWLVPLAVAAATVATAWAPLATGPAASSAGPDGILDLGNADVVLQRRPNACALAALVMLLGAQGHATDEDALARLAGDRLGPEGLTLAQVADVASEAGLEGRWLRASWDDLHTLPAPFAAELTVTPYERGHHLVVVRSVRRDGVLVADPAQGLRGWPPAAFLSAWTGRLFVPAAS